MNAMIISPAISLVWGGKSFQRFGNCLCLHDNRLVASNLESILVALGSLVVSVLATGP